MCVRRHLSKYERAALIVKNALHGRRLASPSLASVNAQRIYHHSAYRISYTIITIGYLLLALAEAPAAFTLTPALTTFVRVLDFAYLGLVVFDLGLQQQLHGLRVWLRRGWVQVRIVLLVAMFINLCINISSPAAAPYVMRCLRPLFLIERLRNVRRVAGNIASTVPKVLNVMILLVLHVLFFSVLGYVLFAGVDGINCKPFRAAVVQRCSTFDSTCTNFFGSLEETAVHLFALLTAANFPSIMIPVYHCNRASVLFFLVFIVVGIYLLLSLTLAVAYATFKNLMADEVIDKYRRMFTGFDMAFVVLTDNDVRDTIAIAGAGNRPDVVPTVLHNPLAPNGAMAAPAIPQPAAAETAGPKRSSLLGTLGEALGDALRASSEESAADDTTLRKSDFVKFFRCLRPDVEQECASQFFDVFDVDNQGKLYRMEFRRLILNFGKLTVKRSTKHTVSERAATVASPQLGPAIVPNGESAPKMAGTATMSPLLASMPLIGPPSSVSPLPGAIVSTSPFVPAGARGALVGNVTPTSSRTRPAGPDGSVDRDRPFAEAAITGDLMGDPDEDDLEVLEVPRRTFEERPGLHTRAQGVGMMMPVEEVTDEEEEDSSAYSPSTITRGGSTTSIPRVDMAAAGLVRELSFARALREGAVPRQLSGTGLRDLGVPRQLSGTGMRQGSTASLLEDRSMRIGTMRTTVMEPRQGRVDSVEITSSPPPDAGSDFTGQPATFNGVPALNGAVAVNPQRALGVGATAARPAAVAWWNGRPQRSRACMHVCRDACTEIARLLGTAFSPQTSPDGYGVVLRRTASMRALMPRGIHPSSWRGRAISFMRTLPVIIICDLAVLVNTASVLYQLSVETDEVPGASEPGVVIAKRIEYSMLAIFIVEVLSRIIFWGPMRFWRESGFNRIDAILVGAAAIGTLLEAASVVGTQVSSVIGFFRFVRLVRVLRVIPGFGMTVSAFADIMPVLIQYVTVMLCSFYCFSIIGMESFAGKLTADNPDVAASSYGQNGFYEINFNTLMDAFVSELYLLALNDWPVLMEGCVAAVGRGARVFYVLFWLVNVVLVLNVVVAFVIESFSVQRVKRETIKRYEEEERQLAAAGQEGHGNRVRAKKHGLEDWRDVILRSGLDFSKWRMSKKAHHFDIYDELYRTEVRSAFAETFSLRRRGSARNSITTWPMAPPQELANAHDSFHGRAANAVASMGGPR